MINTKAAMIISLTKYIKNSQNWEILEPRWQFNNAECLFWREFKTLKTHNSHDKNSQTVSQSDSEKTFYL